MAKKYSPFIYRLVHPLQVIRMIFSKLKIHQHIYQKKSKKSSTRFEMFSLKIFQQDCHQLGNMISKYPSYRMLHRRSVVFIDSPKRSKMSCVHKFLNSSARGSSNQVLLHGEPLFFSSRRKMEVSECALTTEP